jgi:Cytochrome P460
VYFGSPPPPDAPARKQTDHDGGSFGVVWVNDIGHASLIAEKPEKFPVGSIIVREKFRSQDARQPELLAVMVKRAAGFNPGTGDWEYLIVDGGLTKIRERQKKGNCSACHATQKDRDFVFAVPAQTTEP